MKFYAIRHKPTGKFLPAARRQRNTMQEPSHHKPPRLFNKRGHATLALNWWLAGKTITTYDTDGAPIDTYTTPVPSRKKEEMEVVEVCLVV